MKQILLNLIEDTKDIEDFTENGIGYAPIIGRKRAVYKDPKEVKIVYEDRHVLTNIPTSITHSPLQIGKDIWVVEDDGVYAAKIAFLGAHSLFSDDEDLDWEDRELEYDDYDYYWFDDLKKALERFADRCECEADEIYEDAEGVWRAPEKKEEEGETDS